MPSSYSFSCRFELQGQGENLNTWGIRLNNALLRIDKAIAGAVPIVTAGGVYTLSTANGGDDEARAAALLITGTGGTVVIPAVSKIYTVRNSASAAVILTTGSGDTAILGPGDQLQVMCDGANVSAPKLGGMGLKAYVDAQAFAALQGDLPGQTGSAGYFLQTNGTSASWTLMTTAQIADVAAYTAARRGEALAFAIAFGAA